jgi:AcrR family transcriptional regulator
MPRSRRRYELKERARRQEETRRRIVDATVGLHREVGPAKTTVAEIARRAGVGRVTVYNHFPDDAALFGACSAQFLASHPPPDPSSWQAIGDVEQRLRTALRQLYAYFRENEAMLANVRRDAALIPALAQLLGSSEAARGEAAMRDSLLAGRGLRGNRRRRVRAAIGLALAFPTWQRLTREEGLSDDDAVELMVRTVGAA